MFKSLSIFAKHPTLDVWQGSDYASGSRRVFYSGFKRNAEEHVMYATLIRP